MTLIEIESTALGDNIAWIPYVEEYYQATFEEVYCITAYNNLFKPTYTNIHFISKGHALKFDKVFKIGWYSDQRNPVDCRTIPLQKVASDILKLPFKEIRTKISKDNHNPIITKPYVVISTASTALAKYWNNPNGWQDVVNHLTSLNYIVVNVGREKNNLNNVLDYCGIKPMYTLVNLIQHAKFFIGLASGLSWLAHGLDKEVIMISGFSQPWCEFTTPYRIINTSVCHGCFNNSRYTFTKEWEWCPTYSDFICTKSISSQSVIHAINQLSDTI